MQPFGLESFECCVAESEEEVKRIKEENPGIQAIWALREWSGAEFRSGWKEDLAFKPWMCDLAQAQLLVVWCKGPTLSYTQRRQNL